MRSNPCIEAFPFLIACSCRLCISLLDCLFMQIIHSLIFFFGICFAAEEDFGPVTVTCTVMMFLWTCNCILLGYIQGYQRSCIPFFKHVLSKKKRKHWYHKTKSVIGWKCPPCSAVHAFSDFLIFPTSFWRICSVMLKIHKWIFCFSSNVCRLFLLSFSLGNHQRWKCSGVRSRDQQGHKFQRIMQSPKKLHIICVVECVVFAIIPCFCSSTSNKDMKFIISVW